MQWWKRHGWKILGLASFVGVAATGAVIVRAERHRRAYTPEEIRERLHARLAEANADHRGAASGIGTKVPARFRWPGPTGARGRCR